MKKFLYKIFFYFLIIGTLSFLLQYFIDKGLRNYDIGLLRDWNRIFKGQINSDIIILGSSRARGQYNPKIIEDEVGLSCYNLGVGAGRIAFEEARWYSLLKFNASPKFLIKNIDIFSLRLEKNIVYKEQCLPYLSEPTMYPYLKKIDNNIYYENIIPLYKYRGFRTSVFNGISSYFSLMKENKPAYYYKGFGGSNEKWNDEKNKILINKIIVSEAEINFGIHYLENLIQDCKRKNITIILVHAPLYFELQKKMVQKNFFDLQILELAKKNGIQFWNYSQDSISFNKEYFYNVTHLNRNGAEEFSKKLAKDLAIYIHHLNN